MMPRRISKMRLLRESRNLSQVDVAVLSGVSAATVYRAERNGQVRASTRQRIARVFGIPPEVLFTGDVR